MSDYMLSVSKVCFLVHLLLEGLQRSSGVLFMDIREWLGCSRQLAVIPFALNKVVYAIVELMYRFMCKDKSPGPFIGWGCILSAVGIGACFLSTDIVWHSVFWGIVFGSGIGVTSPLLLSHLSQNKVYSAKSSLKSTGPSFGCIVLPFLINKLLDHYGLNGCYAILSGITLNCLPFVLIAFYKFRFHFSKTIWSFRRRSKMYEISGKEENKNGVSVYKPTGTKEFYNQSFMENLEPDILERVSVKEGSQSLQYMETIDILQPIIEAKMKMVNHVNPREAFGLHKACSYTETAQNDISKKLSETEESENISTEKHFNDREGNLNIHEVSMESNKRQEIQHEGKKTDFKNGIMNASEIPYTNIKSEKNIDNSITNHNIPEHFLENKSNHQSHHEVKESYCENVHLKEKENYDKKKTHIESETKKDVQEYSPPVIKTINKTFQIKKDLSNHTNQSPKGLLETPFPLEIKVHVVECTVTTTEDFSFSEVSKLPVKRNAYRRHSNSLITASYENIDFTQLFQNNTSSSLHKQQWNYASKMCLISEENESDSENQNARSDIVAVENRDNTDSSSKQKNLRLTVQELVRPAYLAIIYASVIYEFSLVVLLTVFADFAKDTGDLTVTSNFVLVAFGLGGIVGQLSFNHWGNKLLVDGSHAAATVIFLLNGLAVAGILWSINVPWLSGFYALLGFVEAGIMMTLPKLISDYTAEKARTSLYVICKCCSVMAFMCIPCAIGQSRDMTGNYDGLLQVISCMSVLCAILCYFLPKWSGVPYIYDANTGRGPVQT